MEGGGCGGGYGGEVCECWFVVVTDPTLAVRGGLMARVRSSTLGNTFFSFLSFFNSCVTDMGSLPLQTISCTKGYVYSQLMSG